MDITQNNSELFLLHFFGSTFPVGGFQHSNGLEAYVCNNLVTNEKELNTYILAMLSNAYPSMEGRSLGKAYKLAICNDLEKIAQLDSEYTAMRLTKESRSASLKMGKALIRNASNICCNSLIDEYYELVKQKITLGNYPVVAGFISKCLGANLREAIRAYYFNEINNYVQIGIKLIPLGQTVGQRILFNAYADIERSVDKTLYGIDEELSNFTPMLNVLSMEHEKIYTRLYMS